MFVEIGRTDPLARDPPARDALIKMRADLKQLLEACGDPKFSNEATKRLFINPVLIAIAASFKKKVRLMVEWALTGAIGHGHADYVLSILKRFYIPITEVRRENVHAAIAQCVAEMTAVSEVCIVMPTMIS